MIERAMRRTVTLDHRFQKDPDYLRGQSPTIRYALIMGMPEASKQIPKGRH